MLHGPADSGVTKVTGLFDTSAAAREHFFPPTSVLHRRSVVKSIGLWRSPLRSRLPVDCEFQLRALEAGFGFASTHRITAHKFAAGQRYLSYLHPSSVEQEQALQRLHLPHKPWLAECVAEAKASKGYMTLHHHSTIEDFALWCQTNNLPIIGIDNVPGSKQLESARLPERCVLLFGQEGAGMSDEGIAACEVLYEINQYGSTRSMNASAAGAIAMYHWALQHLPK